MDREMANLVKRPTKTPISMGELWNEIQEAKKNLKDIYIYDVKGARFSTHDIPEGTKAFFEDIPEKYINCRVRMWLTSDGYGSEDGFSLTREFPKNVDFGPVTLRFGNKHWAACQTVGIIRENGRIGYKCVDFHGARIKVIGIMIFFNE